MTNSEEARMSIEKVRKEWRKGEEDRQDEKEEGGKVEEIKVFSLQGPLRTVCLRSVLL